MAGIGTQAANSIGKIMLTRNSYSILRQVQRGVINKCLKYSTNADTAAAKDDPAPFFFNEEVQTLLKTLTRPNEAKIFRTQKDGSEIRDPQYKFMTDAELQQAREAALQRGLRRLQMPPVVKERTEIERVLSKDPAIQGHDTSDYVFTDITYGINDYERLIVVREPNGVLRYAKWEERRHINQIYYPIMGREIQMPRMFQQEYMKDLMDRGEYEFILDRACVQFDPHDAEYQRITKTVYEEVNSSMHFDRLRSSRHYGPLVFHLAWTRNIDNLLYENITTERLEDAVLLIKVYNKLNPSAKSATIVHEGDDMKYVQSYIELESSSRSKLDKALRSLDELIKAKQAVSEGIKKAHGL